MIYLPPALGILAGQALIRISPFESEDFNWSTAGYFARLGNLLAFATAAAVACAWAPRFGGVIFAVSLLPQTMQAAASASYDVTTISSCLLFFALIVRLASREGAPTKRQLAGLVVLGFFVALCKLVYAPLLLLTLVLRRRMTTLAFLKLCAAVALAAVVGAVLGSGAPPTDAHQKILLQQQELFMAVHPLRMISILFDTLGAQQDFYARSFLGDFGWLDAPMPVGVLLLLWATLVMAWLGDALRGPSPLGWSGSAIALVASAVSFVGIHLVLYVIWTSTELGVGAPNIGGVQGRYFLPFAAVVLAALAASPAALARRAAHLRAYLLQAQAAASTAALCVMIFTILLRYWIPAPPA